MKKIPFSISHRIAPLLLLLIAVLSFGLLLPWLGFYWDDWAKLLVARLWGLRAYFAYYAEDRPISAWTHIVFTPLLGLSPLAWQLFALLLRWLGAWGMLWCLNILWPFARRQNLVAALLFLVYPVFVEQAASVTFHQQLLQFALFFLSLGAMLKSQSSARALVSDRFAIQKQSALLLLALLAALLQLSVTEYFAPLELVRPLALWLLFTRLVPERRERLRRTLLAWAPYLALLVAFAAWRLFLIRLPGADPYRADTLYALLANPLGTLRAEAQIALADLLRILVTTWSDLLRFEVVDAAPFTLFSYALGLLAGALVVFFLLYSRTLAEEGDPACGEKAWLRQALVLGLAAVLLGPLPAWITGRQVLFDFHSDRYALPAMFGAALLFAAGIEWLAQRGMQRAVLCGVLIALAVGLHLRTANDYRWIWTSQQRFFWQLAWRAPGLQSPTALFLENEPFPNQGLFSTSAALNLMYPQRNASAGNRLDYWVYTLRPRYNTQKPASFQIGLQSTFRTLSFRGSTPDSLLLYNDPAHANCLWVLSARDKDNPYLPALVRDFLPIANLERIRPQAAAPGYPPRDMIGPEPEHGWCYYFEKSDLARQQQDWPSAARLAVEALARGYRPDKAGSNSPYEWMPFIEGLARSGDWQQAARLTRRAHERDAAFQPMFCALWKQWQGVTSAGAVPAETIQFLGCSGAE